MRTLYFKIANREEIFKYEYNISKGIIIVSYNKNGGEFHKLEKINKKDTQKEVWDRLVSKIREIKNNPETEPIF